MINLDGAKPLLMSGPMVQAILEGRKTCTRRVIVPQPESSDCGDRGEKLFWWRGDWDTQGGPRAGVCTHGKLGNGEPTWTLEEIAEHARYQRGDLLWVRETWGDTDADHPLCKDGRKPQQGDRIVYRADPADDYQWSSGPSRADFVWRPAIFMPLWACRLFLRITDVQAERLHDITEQEIIHEGILDCGNGTGKLETEHGAVYGMLPYLFQRLWDDLNAKRGYLWSGNWWVFRYGFRRDK